MLSIIIPVYNEKSSILEVINNIDKLPIVKQLIIVNDGSTDGSKEILNSINLPANINVIHMLENRGKGFAIREGLKQVKGDYTVIQDADLEYDPNDLVKMYEIALEKNLDVIYGNRFSSNQGYSGMNPLNMLGNMIILPLLSSILYRQYIPDEATCYKMVRSTILLNLDLQCERFDYCPEVTAKVRRKGHYIHFLPINYTPRTTNQGKKLNVIRDGIHAVKVLIKYSTWRDNAVK